MARVVLTTTEMCSSPAHYVPMDDQTNTWAIPHQLYTHKFKLFQENCRTQWPTDANTLADTTTKVQNFVVESSPEIGDIAAFPNPGGLGHSAIFAGGSTGRGLLIYAGERDVKVNTTSGTETGVGATSVTFRRYKP